MPIPVCHWWWLRTCKCSLEKRKAVIGNANTLQVTCEKRRYVKLKRLSAVKSGRTVTSLKIVELCHFRMTMPEGNEKSSRCARTWRDEMFWRRVSMSRQIGGIVRSVRWKRLLVTASLVLPVGCASIPSNTPVAESKQRAVPVAIRQFTAQNATPAASPIAMTGLVPRQSDIARVSPVAATTVSATPGAAFADVLPASVLGQSPVSVGDVVEPGRLPVSQSSPISVSSKNSNVKSDDVRYVVARVEYVPVPAPGAESSDTSEPVPSEMVSDSDFLDPQKLDMSTALQLVAGQNPQVAFAHQRILEAAEALWLPSIRAGISLNRHEGNLQNSNGQIVDISRSSLQGGFGARAVGAGTNPVPGLSAEFHLSDAVFAPRIAERNLEASNFSSWGTYHDQMLRASTAYLELLRSHQEGAIARETLNNADELARLTKTFASTGQGAQADADRAATERAIRQNDVARAVEAADVASARLAEVLHLDAPVRVVPTEQQVAPINLVSLAPSIQEMVAIGLSSRPETGENSQLVAAACERLQREKYAPLLPSMLLGLSYGGFGGGVGDTIGNFNDRLDLDVSAVWEIRNFGRGEAAAQEVARAQIEQARYREIETMDRISREVVETRSQVKSRHRQIETSQAAVKAAQQSYARNRQRINEGQGLPIEFLQSLQALDQAQREYLRSVTDYNVAQFRLHHALGWPSDTSNTLQR
jgi:outer membrane protein TolC